MKKLIVLLIVLLGVSLGGNAQIVNTGVAQPVTGANWHRGIEGKISKYVFERNFKTTGYINHRVDGLNYSIHIEYVNKPNYTQVRFIDGQYAPQNRNWVYLQVGEYLWHFKDDSTWYLARCGNQCIVKPLYKEIVIVEREVVREVPVVQQQNYTPAPVAVTYQAPQQVQSAVQQRFTKDCSEGINELNAIIISHAGKVGNSRRLSYKKAQFKIEMLKLRYPDCYQIQGYKLVRNNKDIVKNVLIAGAVTTVTGIATGLIIKEIRKVETRVNTPNTPMPEVPNPNIPKVPENDPVPPIVVPPYNPGTVPGNTPNIPPTTNPGPSTNPNVPKVPVNDPPPGTQPTVPPIVVPPVPTVPPTTPTPTPTPGPGPGYNPGGG